MTKLPFKMIEHLLPVQRYNVKTPNIPVINIHVPHLTGQHDDTRQSEGGTDTFKKPIHMVAAAEKTAVTFSLSSGQSGDVL